METTVDIFIYVNSMTLLVYMDMDYEVLSLNLLCVMCESLQTYLCCVDSIVFSVFKCVIKNNGSEPMRRGKYAVGLTVEGMEVFYGMGVKDIPPGGSVEYTVDPKNWHIKIDLYDKYKYVFSVDPKNEILELNEENNSVSGTFEVKKNK